nr:biotin transporter BioY [uncultured Cohaesibacter sp.]
MERQVAFIALFAALVAALGLMPQFMLPFGVPVSAQSLGVMMAGVILGSRRGALSMILFIVLVLAGLPLLAGGRGGLGVLAGPTVGFFLGWPFAAFVAGLIVEKWGKGNLLIVGTFASIVGGIFVLYLLGVLGMSVRLNKSFMEAASMVLVFIPGDVIKAFVAGFVLQGIAKARPSALLSRS